MNRDVLFSIALEMDLPDIMRLCETSKKVNEYVCKNRNFWVIKLKKTYPKVPIEKIQDPRSLYRKLYNISKDIPRWDYWSALKQQNNDLINSIPFIYKVTYPFIITDGNEWKFYDTFVNKSLSFTAGFPRDVKSHVLLRMIIDDGVPIENYYDFTKYQKILDEERKSHQIKDERIEEIVRYLKRTYHRSDEELSNSLTDILYNYLKEKGQIYPSGTPYHKIYVK